MKIVINDDFGGFGLSEEALKRYNELSGKSITSEYDIERDDIYLVQTVEEMGDAVNDRFSSLKVIEIPDGVMWEIVEYDGNEHIAEQHRTWG